MDNYEKRVVTSLEFDGAQLSARRYAHLAKDFSQVEIHGARAHEESARDLRVG